MKNPMIFALLGVVALLAGACGGRSAQEEARLSAQLAQLDWLVGSWQGEQEGDRIYEQWTKKTDNSLQGRGYIISGKSLGLESQPLDTIFSETMTIGPGKNGLAYEVTLNGQPNTVFTLTGQTSASAVFENPNHDFPQRIAYTLQSDGTLTATVEGTLNGKPMREEFTMRRIGAAQQGPL